MKFRDATTDDLGFITEVYSQAVKSRISTADTSIVPPDYFKNRIEKTNPNRPFWIVEAGDQPIGWAAFKDFYGRPAYQETAEISIYLSEEFHHKGLGTAILEAMIKKSPALGIRNLIGFVFAHNPASMRLFKKAGFVPWGLLPKVAVIDEKQYDLCILGLKTG